MSDQDFDVAVIGAGLAGCSAAIHLAKYGYKVVLLEAQRYPHHKVCGEFLSPECGALLADLGLTRALQTLKPAAIHSAHIVAPDGTHWTSALPGTGIGISRYALDQMMAEQARTDGVNLRTSTTVTHVQGGLDTGFTIGVRSAIGQQIINAKTVIGAQGKRSVVDRQLNRSFFKMPQPYIGLKAHFRGSLPSGHLYLYTFPGGYCGMSEIENGLINVCLLVQQETFQSASRPYPVSVDGFIQWMSQQNPALGRWLSNAERIQESWLSISQIPFVTKQVVVNDILMAGDSAGLIAPVAGDGMGMAMQSGQMVSHHLNLYLSNQISSSELCKYYRAEWWQTFGLRLRLSRVLQTFMLRPQWLTPGLRFLNAMPALGHLLVTHTRGNPLIQS